MMNPKIQNKPAGARDTLANHRAELALAQADKLKAAGKDEDAYKRYRFIVKEYAKTPSAAPADKAITAYESDADFMAKLKAPTTRPTASRTLTAAEKADSLLTLADGYAAAGRTDLAREKYQSIIDNYPTTPAAATAKQKLAGM